MSIEGVSDLELNARGKVELRSGDTEIFAERLRYNRESDSIEADGGVRLQREADRFFGSSLRYNLLDETGAFEAPSYVLQRERTLRGSAERVEFLGKDRYRLAKATFTTCAPGDEDWRVEANEINLDFETQRADTSGPRLRFFDIPIMALPYASFPLENSRKSGFLAPSYAQSTRRGLELNVPYYLNFSPEQDATITATHMAKRGTQTKTDYRYLGASYAGDMRIEHMQEDLVLHQSRTGFSLNHVQNFTPGLVGRVDFNKVTDDLYFVDLTTNVRQLAIGNLQREVSLQYDSPITSGWNYAASVRAQRFQTLQDPLAPIVPPYHRMPQLRLFAGRNNLGGFADLSLPAEYASFVHSSLVQGARASFTPTLAMPIIGPGWYLTPKVGVRRVDYAIEQLGTAQIQRDGLSIPWASVDSGLVFERPTNWFGHDLKQTLEPRVYYLNVPYRNQDPFPLFDTGLADFNYAQMFSENRFAGGDRFGDANQATFGLATRFLTGQGQEVLRAAIAQRAYFSDEQVGLAAGVPLRTDRYSDLIGAFSGRFAQYWSFDAGAQYNERTRQVERYSGSMRFSPEIAKAVSLSYRFNRVALRQMDLAGQWPVAAGWYMVGRYNYSFLDKRVLEGLGGIEYNAGCWVFRGVVQRVQAAIGEVSSAIFFQLEFSGFGSIGINDPVGILKRNVPGYAVTNPGDASLVPQTMRPSLPFQQIF
ncbi:MAG: LPS assembly protein LptD [Betaproteobacteria bacterium]|nr:LPS assembly protein LptD [Betaproteobacteria bacterium]